VHSLDLIAVLHEERAALQALLPLLREEQALLISGKVAELANLIAEKAKIVTRMGELANARHAKLADSGFEPSEGGMRAWLSSSTAPQLQQAWAETLSSIQAAREVNRVNGLLIGRHLSRCQQTINALMGSDGGGVIYGADGQPEVDLVPEKWTPRGMVV